MTAADKTRLAILASGRGLGAQALLEDARRKERPWRFVGLICDRPQAGVLARVKNFDLPWRVIPRLGPLGHLMPKEEHEAQMLHVLQGWQTEWVCLAGYQRILSPHFLAFFRGPDSAPTRVLNIHPSFLPDFPGRDAYRRSFDAQVKQGGVTVHRVDEGMDSGPIVLQQNFPRYPSDTYESFEQRGLAVEHQLYPQALEILLGGDDG